MTSLTDGEIKNIMHSIYRVLFKYPMAYMRHPTKILVSKNGVIVYVNKENFIICIYHAICRSKLTAFTEKIDIVNGPTEELYNKLDQLLKEVKLERIISNEGVYQHV